ncbi:Oligopeptide transport ATP-binding protein OppF (TC 3.A.1.5.1) [Actinomycetales bacterium JB111]|nr:Oligopeptide transport ATP-binding protein OppF (TC 3.A.1.5.1) [Actinomycetales bacterium JB111]
MSAIQLAAPAAPATESLSADESAPGPTRPETVLSVRDLGVTYSGRSGAVDAVRSVSFDVPAGSTVAIVGESGSGKSTSAHAIVGALARAARRPTGQVLLGDRDLLTLRERDLRDVRGRHIGFVPQDPGSSLNPTTRIGPQVAEVLRIHRVLPKEQWRGRVIELLERVGVDRPEQRYGQYPHELSGGQRQRVLIAIALAARPRLVIADEPTSALDATVSRRVLDHLAALAHEDEVATLLITHDLPLAIERADHVVVMRGGRVVEQADAGTILTAPAEPYTRTLLANTPSFQLRTHAAERRVGADATGRSADPAPSGANPAEPAPEPVSDPTTSDSAAEPAVLAARGLTRVFRGRGEPVTAVDGVDLDLRPGRTLALLGESGSGKTTTARLLLGVERSDSGTVTLDGEPVTDARGRIRPAVRRQIQYVHQNPFASLDPRWSIERIVHEPLRTHREGTPASRWERAREMLAAVGLGEELWGRRPAELSGGQRQRVAIARALVLRPRVVVLDEPVSALDVTVQAQILDLLHDIQVSSGVAYLIVTHDLAVAGHVADDVVVLRDGLVVEAGDAASVLGAPRHPFTRELLAAVPDPFAVHGVDAPGALPAGLGTEQDR